MDISILICTYNRAEELRRTLCGMCNLIVPNGLRWELLAVDNNSTDHTRTVILSFEGSLPIRYTAEHAQGRSNALNRGIEECSAPMILMTDDDVDVTPAWLASYYDAARRYPEGAFFGGKILTRWESTPPPWILENVDWLSSITRCDHGETPVILSDTKRPFVGANMAIRKSVFDSGYRFRPDLGVRGDNRSTPARHGGEDGEFQARIIKGGLKGVYVPDSVVYHRERSYRFTRRYTRWYFREQGRDARRREGVQGLHPLWFGIPRYLWRLYFAALFRYAITRPVSSSRLWLRSECELARIVGDMMECRALTSVSDRPIES